MSKDTIIQFKTPEAERTDPLTDLLRTGAQQLIANAVEAELLELLGQYADSKDEQGRQMIVRNGYLPVREIQTGIGSVKVKVPKVRDRSGSGICFRSNLLPPYLRRTKSMEELLPWLYLKGLSTGDFQEALAALLGKDAKGLSAGTISRLKDGWRADLAKWQQQKLDKKRYVYFWADGVYFNIRGDEARQCILVIVGVDEHGHKEFAAIEDGYRESEQSWLEVLNSLKQRGLQVGHKLAIGDGALGFSKALSKAYGETRHQRYWVHKTANVLNKLPKGAQAKAKSTLHQIWMAASCLEKDRETLLAFYDFPAAHWQHIRTSNPIESTFATVRLRANKTRGCVSRQTILSMVFQLGQSASKRWRRLRGFKHLADVIRGVKFENGVGVDTNDSRVAA